MTNSSSEKSLGFDELDKNVTLDDILDDPNSLKKFKEFVISERSEDNLLFWLKIRYLHDLTNTRSKENALQVGMEVFKKFIESGAEMEMSVSSKDRKTIEHGLQENNLESVLPILTKIQHMVYENKIESNLPILTKIQHMVYENMITGSYARYIMQ